MHQLFLKCNGIGGDDDASAILHCPQCSRDQIGVGLACTGARFDQQVVAFIERPGDGAQHLDLLRTVFEIFEIMRKRTAMFQQGSHFVHIQRG